METAQEHTETSDTGQTHTEAAYTGEAAAEYGDTGQAATHAVPVSVVATVPAPIGEAKAADTGQTHTEAACPLDSQDSALEILLAMQLVRDKCLGVKDVWHQGLQLSRDVAAKSLSHEEEMCLVKATRVNLMWATFLVKQLQREEVQLCPGFANISDRSISGKCLNESNRAHSLKLESAALLAVVGWSNTCLSVSDAARPKSSGFATAAISV